MPIYEFKCRDCSRLSSEFARSIDVPLEPCCEHCGSTSLERIPSSFAYRSSGQRGHHDYSAEPEGLDDFRDPHQIGRGVERQFEQYGVEMPHETREMIDAAREREFPGPLKGL